MATKKKHKMKNVRILLDLDFDTTEYSFKVQNFDNPYRNDLLDFGAIAEQVEGIMSDLMYKLKAMDEHSKQPEQVAHNKKNKN
jgi:hypothetical protein